MASLPPLLVERLLLDADFQPGCRPAHFRAVVPDEQASSSSPPPPPPFATCNVGEGWLFKETGMQRLTRRPSAADRWRNCGGIVGSRVLPGHRPKIRRRYGKLLPSTTNEPLLQWCATDVPGEKRSAARRAAWPTAREGFAYHEYTLLDLSKPREDGTFEDLASTVHLFHIVPVKEAIARAPRLGLPSSLMLSSEEEELLNAVLVTEFPEHVQALPRKESPDRVVPAQPSAQISAEPPQRIKVTAMEIISRISDVTYEPGHRPELLQSVQSGWYKEPGKTERARRGLHTDRWKHSGGARSTKDLHCEGLANFAVRRRTGSIYPPGKPAAWRYHQYTLLRLHSDGLSLDSLEGAAGRNRWDEDLDSPVLFHVQHLGYTSTVEESKCSPDDYAFTPPTSPPLSLRRLSLSDVMCRSSDMDLLPDLASSDGEEETGDDFEEPLSPSSLDISNLRRSVRLSLSDLMCRSSDMDLLPDLASSDGEEETGDNFEEPLSPSSLDISNLPRCPSSYQKRPRSLSGVMSASQGPQQRVATAIPRSEDEHVSSSIVAVCTSSAVTSPVSATAPASGWQDVILDCDKSDGLPDAPLAPDLRSICLPLCELDLDEIEQGSLCTSILPLSEHVH